MSTKILTKRTEKKVYFDQYWDTRDLPSADLRSQHRAEIAYQILCQKRGKLLDVGCGVNPTKVLLNCRQALNPKGEVILSLPNEFHLKRRWDIFWGKLDFIGAKAPHLRLFNYAEIEKLIEECGLKIIAQREISIIPPRWKHWNWLGELLLQISPDLC